MELLKLAERDFDVFLTIDQNLRFQQNLSKSSLAIIVVKVQRNRLRYFLPLLGEIRKTLLEVRPGELVSIGS